MRTRTAGRVAPRAEVHARARRVRSALECARVCARVEGFGREKFLLAAPCEMYGSRIRLFSICGIRG